MKRKEVFTETENTTRKIDSMLASLNWRNFSRSREIEAKYSTIDDEEIFVNSRRRAPSKMIEEDGQKLEKPLFESLLSAWVQEKKLRVDLPFVAEEKKKQNEHEEDGVVISFSESSSESDEELDKMKSKMVDVLLECDTNSLCHQILKFTCTQVNAPKAGLYLCEGQSRQNISLIGEYPSLEAMKLFSPYTFLLLRALSQNERLAVQDKNSKMTFVIQPLYAEYSKPVGVIVVGYENQYLDVGMDQWPYHKAMAQMALVSADFLMLKLQSFFLWKHLEDVFDDCSDLFSVPQA